MKHADRHRWMEMTFPLCVYFVKTEQFGTWQHVQPVLGKYMFQTSRYPTIFVVFLNPFRQIL
jgi:hypothetical protein